VRTNYSHERIESEIVKMFEDGRELNYILGWLKGLNESDRFSDTSYQLLQEFAIVTFIFHVKHNA